MSGIPQPIWTGMMIMIGCSIGVAIISLAHWWSWKVKSGQWRHWLFWQQ